MSVEDLANEAMKRPKGPTNIWLNSLTGEPLDLINVLAERLFETGVEPNYSQVARILEREWGIVVNRGTVRSTIQRLVSAMKETPNGG